MNEVGPDILKRIFEHLTVQELVAGPLRVCRKWHHVVLFWNHRRLTPSGFGLLNTSTTTSDSPLRRWFFLRHNLLKDGPNGHSPFGEPAAKGTVTKERGKLVSSKDSGLLFFDSMSDTGVGQYTHIVDLKMALEGVLREDMIETFLDQCPEYRARVKLVPSPTKGLYGVTAITVSLDNSRPLLPPYENSTMTAYTRDAMHVERTEEGCLQEAKEICLSVRGYPKGVRRLIVLLTFYGMAPPAVKNVSVKLSL